MEFLHQFRQHEFLTTRASFVMMFQSISPFKYVDVCDSVSMKKKSINNKAKKSSTGDN